ncbi:MAG: nitrilase-related carbon-nitrogen hydrolase [Woeseiaceae bacterium]
MSTLNVTLIQADLAWHDAEQNRERFGRAIAALDQPTDLIVLPEMFTTGFTMDAETHAETMEGATLAWMREQAAVHDAAVCGSVIVTEAGRHYNRFLFVRPDGSHARYDKRHLFGLAGETGTTARAPSPCSSTGAASG